MENINSEIESDNMSPELRALIQKEKDTGEIKAFSGPESIMNSSDYFYREYSTVDEGSINTSMPSIYGNKLHYVIMKNICSETIEDNGEESEESKDKNYEDLLYELEGIKVCFFYYDPNLNKYKVYYRDFDKNDPDLPELKELQSEYKKPEEIDEEIKKILNPNILKFYFDTDFFIKGGYDEDGKIDLPKMQESLFTGYNELNHQLILLKFGSRKKDDDPEYEIIKKSCTHLINLFLENLSNPEKLDYREQHVLKAIFESLLLIKEEKSRNRDIDGKFSTDEELNKKIESAYQKGKEYLTQFL